MCDERKRDRERETQDLTSGSIVNKQREREGESDINNPVFETNKSVSGQHRGGSEKGRRSGSALNTLSPS